MELLTVPLLDEQQPIVGEGEERAWSFPITNSEKNETKQKREKLVTTKNCNYQKNYSSLLPTQ